MTCCDGTFFVFNCVILLGHYLQSKCRCSTTTEEAIAAWRLESQVHRMFLMCMVLLFVGEAVGALQRSSVV